MAAGNVTQVPMTATLHNNVGTGTIKTTDTTVLNGLAMSQATNLQPRCGPEYSAGMQRKDGSSGTMDPIRQENVRDRPVKALVTPLTKKRNPGAKKAARRKRKALQKRGLWIEPGQAWATTVDSENATTPTVVTNESNLGRDGDKDMGAQEHITPEREDDNERVEVKDGVMEIGNEVDSINNADEESVDRAIDTLFEQLGRSAVVCNRITAPFSADQLEDLRAESLQMLTEAHMAGEVPNSSRGS